MAPDDGAENREDGGGPPANVTENEGAGVASDEVPQGPAADSAPEPSLASAQSDALPAPDIGDVAEGIVDGLAGMAVVDDAVQPAEHGPFALTQAEQYQE
jgi:hypothetical protein